jgi:hypothetical protein
MNLSEIAREAQYVLSSSVGDVECSTTASTVVVTCKKYDRQYTMQYYINGWSLRSGAVGGNQSYICGSILNHKQVIHEIGELLVNYRLSRAYEEFR